MELGAKTSRQGMHYSHANASVTEPALPILANTGTAAWSQTHLPIANTTAEPGTASSHHQANNDAITAFKQWIASCHHR